MIITRTPFRVSFAGGGSDLPAFYVPNRCGAVLSAAVRHYMYVVIHPYFQDKIRIKYSQVEDVERVEEIRHPIVRACLQRVGVHKGIEIASFADVRAGTGLGSSSAFTVGLLHALYAYRGERISPLQLAAEACTIELDILGEPIGKQDQYAAACGGLNVIRFHADDSVQVQPVHLARTTMARLEQRLRLYAVGGERSASRLLRRQARAMESDEGALRALQRMVAQVDVLERDLTGNDARAMGDILHQGWLLKRGLTDAVTTSDIDALYEHARELGATGGKLLGAGGGGFLLLDHPDHETLSAALGLRTLAFRIDFEGARLQRFE